MWAGCRLRFEGLNEAQFPKELQLLVRQGLDDLTALPQ